jgi:hypothetical protein
MSSSVDCECSSYLVTQYFLKFLLTESPILYRQVPKQYQEKKLALKLDFELWSS